MYATEKSLERWLNLFLEKQKVHKIDGDNLKKFLDEAVAQQIGILQRKNYFVRLSALIKDSDKPLSNFSKDDIKKLIARIERNEEWQPVTKKNMKDVVKKYFQWLNGYEWKSKEYPDCVKWIKTGIKRMDLKLPEDVLTKEDVLKLVSFATNTRDKAMIYALYETGARLGEFLRLRIKDVVFDKYGAKIHITKGKTGARVVRIVSSSSLLAQWMHSHPHKENRDSLLWLNRVSERVGYRSFSKMLARAKERTGIKKKVNPHAFRHARATHLASVLTHAELCKFFGWTMSSDMPQIYIHMNGDTIEEKLLDLYGIKQEEKKEEATKQVICERCKYGNLPESNFCFNCGLPLNEKILMESEKEKDTLSEIIDKEKLSEMIKKIVMQEMGKK